MGWMVGWAGLAGWLGLQRMTKRVLREREGGREREVR